MYNNVSRRIPAGGARSSTSMNPKNMLQDITEKIHILRPEASPLQSIFQYIKRGAKPKSHKVEVMQYHAADPYDYCSNVVMGAASGTAGWDRFALLTLDQPSRPETNGSMYYQPQDKLFIVATNQTVEVVMTPSNAIGTGSGNSLVAPADVTGNTTTLTAPGTVLVRSLTPSPILPFTTSDVIAQGRTIYESQRIEAEGHERDLIFDFNYVEHKEATLQMTEDQRYLVQTLSKTPDFDFQQEQTITEFKQKVDMNMLFSERNIDLTVPGRPKRHMNGLFNIIQTNVGVYNPDNVNDWERLVANFMHEMAFRYNPNGNKKIAIAGPRFMANFNLYFKDYRLNTQNTIGKDLGLNIDTYNFLGNQLALVRSDVLRQGTPLEHWCFVIDPAEAEQRIVKDYATRFYQNNDERDLKLMVEWQGTVAWHLEQSHALLRTA